MVKKWNSLLAKVSWYHRERWHHLGLQYVTHIATLRVKQSYRRHKVGHSENIYIQTDNIIVLD